MAQHSFFILSWSPLGSLDHLVGEVWIKLGSNNLIPNDGKPICWVPNGIFGIAEVHAKSVFTESPIALFY